MKKLLVASLIAAAFSGCPNREPGRVIINGKVVLQGNPDLVVEDVTIDGSSIEAGPPSGTGSGGKVIIRAGKSLGGSK